MRIWAIADLHLSFGIPNKGMDLFGPAWDKHTQRVAQRWQEQIAPEDLVLIPGDISWASHFDDALADLQWIADLPGEKVMIRGNHDFWWSSPSKMRKLLPPSLHILQNDAMMWNGVAIGGSRLWDCKEVSFPNEIIYTKNPAISTAPIKKEKVQEEAERIYTRELNRLELSFKELDANAKTRIAMTHYPPVNSRMEHSRARDLLEQYQIDICVFGHLHSVREDLTLFGKKHGIHYHLASCDYLACKPILLLEF